MLQNVLPCHVAVGADIVLVAANTLPHHASDGIHTTAITYLSWVYNTCEEQCMSIFIFIRTRSLHVHVHSTHVLPPDYVSVP